MVSPAVSEALCIAQGQSLLHSLEVHSQLRHYPLQFHGHINRVIAQFAAQAPTKTNEMFFVRLTQSMGADHIFSAIARLNANDQHHCAIAERLSSWSLPQTKEQFFELLTFTMTF